MSCHVYGLCSNARFTTGSGSMICSPKQRWFCGLSLQALSLSCHCRHLRGIKPEEFEELSRSITQQLEDQFANRRGGPGFTTQTRRPIRLEHGDRVNPACDQSNAACLTCKSLNPCNKHAIEARQPSSYIFAIRNHLLLCHLSQ